VGVDLGDLCVRNPVALEDLAGKTVAIDAYNALYQFLASIRGPDGTPLMDAQGRVTSHLTGLFSRTANLVEAGILPVYVFDGTPHPLKLATIRARSAVKEKAREAYAEALRVGDMEKARQKAQQTSSLTPDMVAQAKRLLDALGLPTVDAPGEGEAQATVMVQRSVAHAVASQDYDAVLFGAPRLVRNMTMTGRRKLPGRQAFVDIAPELIPLGETLEKVRLSREQLVDLAVLIGTDYNPGVSGIGPKTALELLREHGSLEAILEKAETGEGHVWKKLREGQDGLGEFEAVRNLFLEPPVAAPLPVKAGRLDESAAREMLVTEHQFSADRIESGLAKYRASKVYRQQKTLGEWG
jgi:flap endonuclease-1